jgi:hypothetical protein
VEPVGDDQAIGPIVVEQLAIDTGAQGDEASGFAAGERDFVEGDEGFGRLPLAMDGGLEKRADAGGVAAIGDGGGEDFEFVVLATGEKSEIADVDSGHGFFKIPEPGNGVKHGSVATEHGGDIHEIGEFGSRDAAAFASEPRGFLVQHGVAAPGFERGPQRVKSGQRAWLVRVDEDSDVHDGDANDSLVRLASAGSKPRRCWMAR